MKDEFRMLEGFRTWVRVVDRFEQIPVWVTYYNEDDEMKYYLTDYLEGVFWGVPKEGEK